MQADQFGVSLLENKRFCGVQVLGDMVVYPNKMTFDIMEGGGVPPDPVGMLQVKARMWACPCSVLGAACRS